MPLLRMKSRLQEQVEYMKHEDQKHAADLTQLEILSLVRDEAHARAVVARCEQSEYSHIRMAIVSDRHQVEAHMIDAEHKLNPPMPTIASAAADASSGHFSIKEEDSKSESERSSGSDGHKNAFRERMRKVTHLQRLRAKAAQFKNELDWVKSSMQQESLAAKQEAERFHQSIHDSTVSIHEERQRQIQQAVALSEQKLSDDIPHRIQSVHERVNRVKEQGDYDRNMLHRQTVKERIQTRAEEDKLVRRGLVKKKRAGPATSSTTPHAFDEPPASPPHPLSEGKDGSESPGSTSSTRSRHVEFDSKHEHDAHDRKTLRRRFELRSMSRFKMQRDACVAEHEAARREEREAEREKLQKAQQVRAAAAARIERERQQRNRELMENLAQHDELRAVMTQKALQRRRHDEEVAQKANELIQKNVEQRKLNHHPLKDTLVGWDDDRARVHDAYMEKKKVVAGVEEEKLKVELKRFVQERTANNRLKGELESKREAALEDLAKRRHRRYEEKKELLQMQRMERELLARNKMLEAQIDDVQALEVIQQNRFARQLRNRETADRIRSQQLESFDINRKKLEATYGPNARPMSPRPAPTEDAMTPDRKLSKSPTRHISPIRPEQSEVFAPSRAQTAPLGMGNRHVDQYLPYRVRPRDGFDTKNSLANPTRKMLNDPTLSPAVREKAARLVELLEETEPHRKTPVFARSVTATPQHLTRRSVQQELLRSGIHVEEPVHSVHHGRKVNPDQITKRLYKIPQPAAPPPMQRKADTVVRPLGDLVDRFYTEAQAHQALNEQKQERYLKAHSEMERRKEQRRPISYDREESLVERLAVAEPKRKAEAREKQLQKMYPPKKQLPKKATPTEKRIAERLHDDSLTKQKDTVQKLDQKYVQSSVRVGRPMTPDEIAQSASRLSQT